MKYSRVEEFVAGLPYIRRPNAKMLYDFIVRHRLRSVLELGFAHGVSSCFVAAALDEVARRSNSADLAGSPPPRLTTVDLVANKHRDPSIEKLLDGLGLQRYVVVHRRQTGYHWFLHDEIKEQSAGLNRCRPKYDLVIHDCSKDWTQLSSGFFLTDKLLKPGGWIVWDDVRWTYAGADRRRSETHGIPHRSMSDAERETPHVKEVVELLAMQQPNYRDFRLVEDGLGWAWAQKARSADANAEDCKRIEFARSYSLSWYGGRLARSMYRASRSLLAVRR